MLRLTNACLACALAHFFLLSVSLSAEKRRKVSRPEIERIVQEYLAANPEVVVNAIRAAQLQQVQRETRSSASPNVSLYRSELFRGPASSAASPDSVTIVVFLDYRCGFCKAVYSDLRSLFTEDQSVRVVFKDLPILGADSVTGARVALAAHNQGRYLDVHDALFAGATAEALVREPSIQVKIDTQKLLADMQSISVTERIAANQRLAAALGVEVTPAIVIGDEIILGAVSREELKRLVAQVKRDTEQRRQSQAR